MKKICLILFMGFAVSTVAFADHAQDSFGLGGIFGVGWGMHGTVVYPDFYPASLSLKIPKVPIFWGVNLKFQSNYDFGLGITGDWYFFEPNLVSETKTNDDGAYKVMIDWYMGVGLYGNMYFGDNYFGGNGGVRVPVGVSWHALQEIKKLEVSVGSVIGLGVGGPGNGDKPYFHWYFIPVELAVRWWFG